MLDEIISLVSDLSNVITQTSDAISSEVVEFNQDLDAIETAFSEIQEFVKGCRDQTEELINDAHDTLEEAAEQADEAFDEAEETVEYAADQIDEIKDRFSGEIADLREQSAEAIQDSILQPFASGRDQLIDVVDQFMEEQVYKPVQLQRRELLEKGRDHVQEVMDDAIDSAKDELDEFRSTIIGGSEASSQQRQEASIAREILDELLRPIFNQVDRVASLGDSVGIHLG